MITFAHPERLNLLLYLLLPALLLVGWGYRQRRRALARLGDAKLVARLSGLVNGNGRWLRHSLWFLAVGLTIIALARPQWGYQEQQIEQKGVQLMVALDVSPSMLAEDIQPSRLLRARQEIADLLGLLGGDEVGLVLFSGAAFIQFPLTNDYNTARNFLDSANPGVISRSGTALDEAVRTAMQGFDPQRASQKVILIMTDGEGHEGDPVAMAREAAAEGVIIYTVGFGSPEGSPIPFYDPRGQLTGYKQDENGQTVLSRLDETTLQQMAQVSNGRYFHATALGTIANDIAAELNGLQQALLENRLERLPIERFQLFLFAAVVALFLFPLVPERRHLLPPRPNPLPGAGVLPPGPAALLLLMALFLTGCTTGAARLVAEGNQAFVAGEYETALDAYVAAQQNAPELAEPPYNSANSFYRQGSYDQAQSLLAQALSKAEGVLVQFGWFNQGNVAYSQQDFATAVSAYQDALRLNPADADAKHNLELALQQLAQQQEEAQQQSEQQQNEADQGQPDEQSPEQPAEEPPQAPEQPSKEGNPEASDSSSGAPESTGELTEEQARQLLETIGQNTETLQEHLQLRFQARGQQPEKDW